ncbi:hypothetical protein BJY00DRAFT_234991 [Aspergillus carlsbadensis]|nr:hypothetical protein BJY00DRAFT_234991 [Aspergillus carlsbadensis]
MSTTEGPTRYLAEFKNLSSKIALYTPDVAQPQGTQPTLVIITAWLLAAPKHISKYAELYRTNLPHASILLVRPVAGDMVWTANGAQYEALEPALSVIRSFTASYPQGRIILHAFSNAGSHAAVQLLGASEGKYPGETIALPLTAVILDSCPGSSSARLAARAMITALPKSVFVRVTGAAIIWFALAVIWVLHTLGLYESPIDNTRWVLNQASSVTARPGVVRRYLYSKGDVMVPWEAVVEHAEEARAVIGGGEGQVKAVEFEGSGHVGHLAVDPERYWRVIKDVL